MADQPRKPPMVITPDGAQLSSGRFDYTASIEITANMSPLAADTVVQVELARTEAARFTYAVPAEEETKRSSQYNWRIVIFGLFAAGGIAVACFNPALSVLIGGVLTTFAAGAFGPTIVRSFKKKTDG